MTTHEYKVEMTCSGCSGAVTRILTKKLTEPGSSFDVDLENKKVTITSELPADTLTEMLKKCGKEVSYIGVK
uniref:Copper transport protein ATOX1 n=1 Tax=Ciona savignyi TaxID=51511 RepID=H2Z7W5_CIOSA